jgi:hypothetical protein
MKRIVDKYWKTALFTLAGAGIGFAYWKFIGCTSGTCPLTANWHTSTLFGGLIGMLAMGSRKDPQKENGNPRTGDEVQAEASVNQDTSKN